MESNISVVIPVYNGANTILRALMSVRQQTLAPAEVIVVDDGSLDETATVVSRFLVDSRLAGWRLIRQTNKGPASARDVGIKSANGRHIALLDADDEWMPAKLELSMDSIRTMGLDIVGAGLPRERSTHGDGCRLLGQRSLLFRNPYFTSTVVFSRDSYFQVGGFDVSQRYSEDYKLWLAFAWHGKRVGLLDEAHATYRPAHDATPGLSAQLWQMERSEICNYLWLYRSRLINPASLGAASAFSCAKFLLRLVRRS